MKLDYRAFEYIINDIKPQIIEDYINNVSIINSRDFIISFSKLKDKQLFVSLNHQTPFISLVDKQESKPTVIGLLNDTLRKNVKGGKITNIELFNSDRIVKISYSKANDYFEIENKTILLELIPHRPNMILLDQKGLIDFAFHYTSLTSPHVILKGITYKPMQNSLIVEESDFSFEVFNNFISEYLSQSNEDRKSEKYENTIKFVKSKIKSIKHKISSIDKEVKTANEKLSYKDIGQNILSYSYTPELIEDYIKEENISYDSTMSISQNAEKYFKQYKKAKRTLEINEEEKKKAYDSLNKYETILAQLPYMNETDLLDLSKELLPAKKDNKAQNHKVSLTYIEVNNTKIYFGKNAHQNDEITFRLADPSDQYFHIKDLHGSHVLVKGDTNDPEVILTAAEICLILSGKETGEIMHTTKKFVKKGSSLGEAFVKEYKLIRLNEVRKETITKIKNLA